MLSALTAEGGNIDRVEIVSKPVPCKVTVEVDM